MYKKSQEREHKTTQIQLRQDWVTRMVMSQNTKYSKETHMRKQWPPRLGWELFPYSWTTSHDSLGQRHWLAHRDFSAKELIQPRTQAKHVE